MGVPKFKVGQRVRVSLDIPSVFRGRTGTIQQQLPEDTRGFWYMVTFESRGLRNTMRFSEQDLELVAGWRPIA